MSRLGFLALGVMLAAALAGCAPRPSQSRDVIGITPNWVVSAGRDPLLSWLDDNTIVYQGLPPEAKYYSQRKLYLWRLGSEPRLYQPDRWPIGDPVMAYMCADKGKIYLSVGEVTFDEVAAPPSGKGSTNAIPIGARAPILSGPLGKERPGERHIFWLNDKLQRIAPTSHGWGGRGSLAGHNCDDLVDPNMIGRVWGANYSGKAYLEFKRTGSTPIFSNDLVFTSLTTGFRREIHLDQQVEFGCEETPAWDDSFFITDCSAGWDDETRAMPFREGRRIMPDGAVTLIRIPNGPRVWGADVVPYRDGYIVAGTGSVSRQPNDYGGVYLFDGRKLSKRLKGQFRVAAVSPSGCRAAFNDETNSKKTVAVVAKLCE